MSLASRSMSNSFMKEETRIEKQRKLEEIKDKYKPYFDCEDVYIHLFGKHLSLKFF